MDVIAPELSVDTADDAVSGLGLVPAALAAATLAACGSGGTTPTAVTPPVQQPQSVTQEEASRFLAQGTMGSSRADIERVRSLGYDGWLTEQFAMARETSHFDWLLANGFPGDPNNPEGGLNPTIWRQLISAPDQLRQRVGMALLDILVVSVTGVGTPFRGHAVAAYLDLLMDNAFGNFRTLIGAISTNAAMASFLTFLGNQKANAATGSQPDENYARELMQLFTIGLQELNADGTVRLVGGQPVETYTNADVQGLARVFTGWTYDSSVAGTSPERNRRPLVQNAAQHESGIKTFLGTTIPAGTDGVNSLRLALDALFAHANVGPFIGRQLIQRLVTSNPSPAYVQRVSAVFANNGSGTRGDLRAVVRAILTDTEARSAAGLTSTSFGKLREPFRRLTNWARAFGVTSLSGAWAFGDTSSSSTRLAQSPARAPSVFNFFRPGYAPPGSTLAAQSLVAPELQLANEPSVVAYINYMRALVQSGTGDAVANYSSLLTLVQDSAALVGEVAVVLAAGQLSAATVATIRGAVDSIDGTTTAGQNNRVWTAVLLVLAAPEYLVQK